MKIKVQNIDILRININLEMNLEKPSDDFHCWDFGEKKKPSTLAKISFF